MGVHAPHKGPLLGDGVGLIALCVYVCVCGGTNRLQGTVLDDHALQLKISNKKPQGWDCIAAVQTSSEVCADTRAPPSVLPLPADNGPTRKRGGSAKVSAKCKKLLVKNLAFEATKRDLQQLFGAYGRVRQAPSTCCQPHQAVLSYASHSLFSPPVEYCAHPPQV